VLLSLSLTLMGISLAVNATATNWKGKLAKQSAEKKRFSVRLDVLTKAIEVETKELDIAKELKDSQDKSYGGSIRDVNAVIRKTKAVLAKTHTDYQSSQIKFENDLQVQKQVSANLKTLQDTIAAFEKQRNSFVSQNEELNDLVSQLEREVQELTRSESILKSK
jgi:chromosome segregation ATPase